MPPAFTESRGGFADHAPGFTAFAEIAAHERHITANLACKRLDLGFVRIEMQREFRALGAERAGQRSTDAGAGAGDEYRLAAKIADLCHGRSLSPARDQMW
jgi:hypothetical protein